MPIWNEFLRNLPKPRRAYIVVMLVSVGALFAILRWSTALPALAFNDFTGDYLQDLFFSLLLITVFMERALEIYVIAWRAEGRSERESDVNQASGTAAKTKAERELFVYRAETGRYVALASVCAGIVISLAGVRVLSPLVSAPTGGMQQTWLFVIDVLLTAGLLAGGSKLNHEVIAVVSTVLEMTKGRIARQGKAGGGPPDKA